MLQTLSHPHLHKNSVYGRENLGPDELNNLPQIPEQVSDRSWIQTQTDRLQKPLASQ